MLEELGYPQSPTPIHIDNSTAVGIVNDAIKNQGQWKCDISDF